MPRRTACSKVGGIRGQRCWVPGMDGEVGPDGLAVPVRPPTPVAGQLLHDEQSVPVDGVSTGSKLVAELLRSPSCPLVRAGVQACRPPRLHRRPRRRTAPAAGVHRSAPPRRRRRADRGAAGGLRPGVGAGRRGWAGPDVAANPVQQAAVLSAHRPRPAAPGPGEPAPLAAATWDSPRTASCDVTVGDEHVGGRGARQPSVSGRTEAAAQRAARDGYTRGRCVWRSGLRVPSCGEALK